MSHEEITASVKFTRDATYRLLHHANDAPLVVALHGMGQTEDHSQHAVRPLVDKPWSWLFPRGVWPFEVRGKNRIRIGHAWYLYTGDQVDLRASMDIARDHLLAVIDDVRRTHGFSKAAVVGFSQGGYLASYIGPTHADTFCAAGCIAGRIKDEFITEGNRDVRIAQFHGGKDEHVSADLAREAVNRTRAMGYSDVQYFEDTDAKHEITSMMQEQLGQWLTESFA